MTNTTNSNPHTNPVNQNINLKTIFETLDLDQTKVKFRELAHIHHPDKGGDGEMMKQLIMSYKTHLKRLESEQNPTTDKPFDYQIERELIDKIEIFAGIQGIVIELIGKWIWVSGDTKSIKDQLKENSFRYAPKKQLWYFRQEDQAQKYHKSDKTIDEIRRKYGSFSPNTQTKPSFQPALS
jgi:hypothetical protein